MLANGSSVLKVLFDYQIGSLQRTGGISRYFDELIKHLHSDFAVDFKLGILQSRNELLPLTRRQRLIEYLRFPMLPGEWTLLRFLNRQFNINQLTRSEFDVLHPTYYDPYWIKYALQQTTVITVHDLAMIKCRDKFHDSEYTQFESDLEKTTAAADRVIAISENTRDDLVSICGTDANKIDVIYHGGPKGNLSKPKRVKLPEYFLLYVGTRHTYKNFLFFVQSISNILKKNNLYLVCVGSPFSHAEKRVLRELEVESFVLSVQVDDHGLAYCYQHAAMFCYPSLYEGFGLPILEAFTFDCPVVLSNSSCFPEIAQDAGCYFDPTSAEDISEAVQRLYSDKSFAAELVLKGQMRVKDFDWTKTAQQTKECYQRALEQ